MSHLVPLSVLDFAVIGAGQSETTALQQSVELAKHAEALGYQRFWTSEHHNMASVASTAPDLIAMRVADSTTRIKVGAGGVMLPNHAPLSVAERYLTLEAFHPDRVDLGVGRAPGTDGFTAHALRRADASHYAQHLAELDCFINGGFPANHPYAQILAAPRAPPDRNSSSWIKSGQCASCCGARISLRICWAFLAGSRCCGHSKLPRTVRARRHGETYAILAANVIAAETQEKAEWIARAGKLGYIRLARGRLGPLPHPEEAAAHPWSREETEAAAAFSASHIAGDAASVGQRLRALIRETGADELMINATIHGFEDRKHSLELIAEAMSA